MNLVVSYDVCVWYESVPAESSHQQFETPTQTYVLTCATQHLALVPVLLNLCLLSVRQTCC